jgi:hypothetical protein
MNRAAILAVACTLLASGAAASDDFDAAFEIIHNGSAIGHHIVDVEETPDGVVVRTLVRMKVALGPISFFRFDHEALEVWRDGRLQSMSAVTNDNGVESYVNVTRAADAFFVDGAAFHGEAPLDAAPSVYWNKAVTSATRLISAQNGEIIDVTPQALGETQAPDGRLAEQHRLTGTVALNLWYDGARWIGSTFVIDGEQLTYRPVAKEKKRNKLFARLDIEDDLSRGGAD